MKIPPAHLTLSPVPRIAANRRLLIMLSIVAAIIYPVLHGKFGLAADVASKGLAVGALALAAGLSATPGKMWLVAIMGAGALGDMLLEIPELFIARAGAFAAGHVVSMLLYSRHRRDGPALRDRMAAAALIGWGLAMPPLVMPAGAPVGALMLYSVLLCGMAAAALISNFPRRVAVGALLFVLSDTLLIMRMGQRFVGSETLHGLLLWYSYYLGQFGIFSGVSLGLSRKS